MAGSSADAETLQVVEVAGAPCSTLHRDEVAEAAHSRRSSVEIALDRLGQESSVCRIGFDAREPSEFAWTPWRAPSAEFFTLD